MIQSWLSVISRPDSVFVLDLIWIFGLEGRENADSRT